MLRKKKANSPVDTCGVVYSLSLIGGKWKPLILWHLLPGPVRFGVLKRKLPSINERVLIRQLKELEQDGLLIRTAHQELPPRVDYRLSVTGASLEPLLYTLEAWGDKHR